MSKEQELFDILYEYYTTNNIKILYIESLDMSIGPLDILDKIKRLTSYHLWYELQSFKNHSLEFRDYIGTMASITLQQGLRILKLYYMFNEKGYISRGQYEAAVGEITANCLQPY